MPPINRENKELFKLASLINQRKIEFVRKTQTTNNEMSEYFEYLNLFV